VQGKTLAQLLAEGQMLERAETAAADLRIDLPENDEGLSIDVWRLP
jgi:hypothetical protein